MWGKRGAGNLKGINCWLGRVGVSRPGEVLLLVGFRWARGVDVLGCNKIGVLGCFYYGSGLGLGFSTSILLRIKSVQSQS